MSSSRHVADIYIHAKEGCELCSILRTYIPDEVKSIWNNTQNIQRFRFSVNLEGMEVGGLKLHVMSLEFGIASVEICVVSLSSKSSRDLLLGVEGLIIYRPVIYNQEQRGLTSQRFRALSQPSTFMDFSMHQQPQMPGNVDESFSETICSNSTCLRPRLE